MSVDVVLPDGTEVPVDRAVVVGRDPVVPPRWEHAGVVSVAGDLSVSKTHALIELDDGDVWVTDLDSSNGTEIVEAGGGVATLASGVRTALAEGSALRIGSTTVLAFERPRQAPDPYATVPRRDLARSEPTAIAHSTTSAAQHIEPPPPTAPSDVAPTSELPPPAVAPAPGAVPGGWSPEASGGSPPHPQQAAPGTPVTLAHRQVVGQIVPLPLGSRIGAAFLDALIGVLTLGIGWFIWAVILWPQGTSPGKKMVGAVVVDRSTGVVAGADKMALRELVGKGVIGFFTLGISGIVTFFMVLFGRERRGVPDHVAGTIVVPVGTVGVVPIGEGASVAPLPSDGGSPVASAMIPYFADRDLQRAFVFSMLLVAGLVPIAIAAAIDSTEFVPEFQLGSGAAVVLGCAALVAATLLARSQPIARGVGIGVGLIVGASFTASMFDYVFGAYLKSVPGAIGAAACAAGGLGAAAMLGRAWVPRRMPEIAPEDYPGIIASLVLFPVLLLSSSPQTRDWLGFESSAVGGLLVVVGTAVLCCALAAGFVLGARGVGLHGGILGYMLLAWLITPAPYVLLAPGTGLAVEGIVATVLLVGVVALAVWHAVRALGGPPVDPAGPPPPPGRTELGPPPPPGNFRRRWVAATLTVLVPLVAACATDPESGSTSDPAPRAVDLPEISATPQSDSDESATASPTTLPQVVGVTNPPSTVAPSTTVPPATTVPADTAPAPSPAPGDPCSDASVQAVWGAGAHIIDGLCSNGWAYVDTCTGECGDSQIIARHRAGTWEFAIGFPTPMCRADAQAAGVPSQIVDRINWVCAGGGGNIDYHPEPATGVLSIGDRGPRVESLQRELYVRGFLRSGDVDSYFGPGTRDAVRSFQRSAGLEVDGLAGPNTLGALVLPS